MLSTLLFPLPNFGRAMNIAGNHISIIRSLAFAFYLFDFFLSLLTPYFPPLFVGFIQLEEAALTAAIAITKIMIISVLTITITTVTVTLEYGDVDNENNECLQPKRKRRKTEIIKGK